MKTLARPRDRETTLARLHALRPEARPRWGRMSAHQMVCHLADSVRMLRGDTHVTPTLRLRPRILVKWIALYLPVPWPGGLPTSPEIDQARGGTRPTTFDADLHELETLVSAIGETATQSAKRPHPVFGALSDADWLRWAYRHMDHHLRQFGL
ncbi:MAG TPA: DUF1569 domain-containing protein [Gemmatimonadaceae bacterium]